MKLGSLMRRLLCCFVPLLLTGCPAGFAPMAGYQTGEMKGKSKVIYESDLSEARSLQIIEQTVDFKYDLLFSPDGDRKNVSLKHGLRYYIQTKDGSISELEFLSTKPTFEYGGPFSHLYRIGSSDAWVGYGVVPQSDTSKYLKSPTVRYFIKSFTKSSLIDKTEIDVCKQSKIEYAGEIPAIKFCGATGSMLYLVNEKRIIAENAK